MSRNKNKNSHIFDEIPNNKKIRNTRRDIILWKSLISPDNDFTVLLPDNLK